MRLCVCSGQLAFTVLSVMFVCRKEREGSTEGLVSLFVLPATAPLADTLHLLLVRLTPGNTCTRKGHPSYTDTHICASCPDPLISGKPLK